MVDSEPLLRWSSEKACDVRGKFGSKCFSSDSVAIFNDIKLFSVLQAKFLPDKQCHPIEIVCSYDQQSDKSIVHYAFPDNL